MDNRKHFFSRDSLLGPGRGKLPVLASGLHMPPQPRPPGHRPGAPNSSELAQGSTISKDRTKGAASDEKESLSTFANILTARQGDSGPVESDDSPAGTESPGQQSASVHSDDEDEEEEFMKSLAFLDEIEESEVPHHLFGRRTRAKQFPLTGARSLSNLNSQPPAMPWRDAFQTNTFGDSADGVFEGTGDEIPDVSSRVAEPKPDLAVALASLAQTYLGFNPAHGHSDNAKYTSFLLDTIQMLQSEVEFVAKISQAPQEEKSSIGAAESVKDESSIAEESVNCTPVLHRVFCGARHHNHNHILYEDLPVTGRKGGQIQGDGALRGKIVVPSQDLYLRQNPGVIFIIIKEHRCTPDPTATFFGKIYGGPPRAVFARERDDPSLRFERMRIVDPILQKAMVKVAECKPEQYLFKGTEVSWELEAPYHFIFHHRRKLTELMESSPEYVPAVSSLLDYVTKAYGDEYAEAEESISKGFVTKKSIGKLFKPNQMVIHRENGETSVYVLDEWPVQLTESLRFCGWAWAYDGRVFDRKEWLGSIDIRFVETTDIADLQISPLEHASPEVLETIMARGRIYWNMRKRSLMTYSGWDHHRDDFYSEERVMIDVLTYSNMHRTRAPPPIRLWEDSQFERWPKKLKPTDEIPEKLLLLFPEFIFGFSLRQKRWVSLNVDQLEPVKWNKRAIERLVLEDEKKELIKALVDVHVSSQKKMNDIVTSKGNGLIILLHGSPGTGKTLTAECVAEFAQKPLYRVTCGDIGTDAIGAEKYLETVMHLGKIWDCVLLLDEADVFLEERSVMDLQRNSLVSVFLRILEYYEGILILTSNRVGTFDEAFKSRIQIAVRYNPLSVKYRRTIWQNLLEVLDGDGNSDVHVNLGEIEDKLDELASFDINGRQIRNALLTARQLALHRQETLDWQHLKNVLRVSGDFNKYLKGVRGQADEDWARSERWR